MNKPDRLRLVTQSLIVRLGLLALVALVPGVRPALAQVDAHCERCLLDASFEKPDFNAMRVISVSFAPDLSAAKMAKAMATMQEQGFEPLGAPERGRAWVGEIDPIRASMLSRVEGVASVTRASSVSYEVWKDGVKRNKAVPEEPDEGTDEELWSHLRNPVRGLPSRDLTTIRKLARDKGVTIVLPDSRPADASKIAELEELWGARIFFAGDLLEDSSLVKIAGVAVHIGPSPKSFAVRGDKSILLGYGRMLQHLNKVTEAEWVHGIDPEAMGPSMRGSELMGSKAPYPELVSAVESYFKRPLNTVLKGILDGETKFLDAVVKAAVKSFPPGAFFKGKFDYATRESGGIINTMSIDVGKMAREYVAALRDFVNESKPAERTREGFELWLRDNGSAQAAMAHNLVANPDDVLVQQKLDIAKTNGDSLMEFRVDVFEGHTVNSTFRYGMEYHPEEEKGAQKFVQHFFDNAPEKDRYFTGGLDVAMQRDGSFKVIETNPGAQSSFIDASSMPIAANEALSHLLGRRTPLLKALDAAYDGGIEGLSAFLSTLNKRPTETVAAVRQMSKFDVLGWVRDRFIAEWRKNPTPVHARALLKRMHAVAKGGGAVEDEDFEFYIIDRMRESMLSSNASRKGHS